MKFCRRCQWTKEMFDKELLKLEEYIERIPEEERVSDEEYERRLMLCDTCSFMRGGMCGRCGCYVALRAAKCSSTVRMCIRNGRRWILPLDTTPVLVLS